MKEKRAMRETYRERERERESISERDIRKMVKLCSRRKKYIKDIARTFCPCYIIKMSSLFPRQYCLS